MQGLVNFELLVYVGVGKDERLFAETYLASAVSVNIVVVFK